MRSTWASVITSGGLTLTMFPSPKVLRLAEDHAALQPLLDEVVRLLACRLLRLLRLDQLDPDHQPRAAHVADQLVAVTHLQQPGGDGRAEPAAAFEQVLGLDRLDRGQRRRHRDREVGEGERVVAGRVRLEVVAAEGAEDREAATQALANDHDVRLDAVERAGEPLAHPANPVWISS